MIKSITINTLAIICLSSSMKEINFEAYHKYQRSCHQNLEDLAAAFLDHLYLSFHSHSLIKIKLKLTIF